MSVKKTYAKNGKTCRVTFELGREVGADEARLCGEFNDWSPEEHPLERRKDGRLTTTVTLETGQSYRYRYVLDGGRWENDWQADAYVANDFGGEDSLVSV
jgi:1,4-alpha-glucan branching enzyme